MIAKLTWGKTLTPEDQLWHQNDMPEGILPRGASSPGATTTTTFFIGVNGVLKIAKDVLVKMEKMNGMEFQNAFEIFINRNMKI